VIKPIFIIFVIATIFTLGLSFNNFANAASIDEKTRCNEGFELVYRINADKYACVFETTSQKWQNLGIAEQIEQQISDTVETSSTISAEFPFESHYVEVLGSKMHYIDEGEGDPILFIHGNPTSSYLWRNIIPYVSDDARVIAVDLIGMGKSDKPDIDYSFDDHARYLNAFIEELELKNVTLVIHDWGSGLGFNYAANNEENIKGIAFMEALLMPMASYDAFPSPEAVEMFKNFRTPGVGEELIMNQNIFVEQLLPSMILRELSEEEFNHYSEPYPTPESRKPIWKWPNEIPIGGEPKNTHDIVSSYNQWIQTTETPMLMIYATPGVLGNEMAVQWAKDNVMNLETANVGPGLHFIQEDQPDEIGKGLDEWYQTLKSESASVMEEEVVKVSMQEQNNDVKIEWLGWSFYRITTPGGVVILTNPWYENPDNPTSLDDIPKADIILVPTGHPDEVGNALEIAAKNNSTIVASHDLVNLVWKDKDQPRSVPVTFDGIPIKTAQFQPGTIRTIDGITIRAVTALHGNWETGGPAMGFIITMENGHVIYFSGSTDLTLDMKLWGEMFKPDTAILYTHSSMDPHEIAMMAQFLSENNPNLKTVLPLHHRINAPEGHTPADLRNAIAELGLKVEVIDPQPGMVYTLSK